MINNAKEGLLSQNPNPVLCVAMDGTVIYANITAQDIVCQSFVDKGKMIPSHWEELIRDCLDSDTNKTDEIIYKDKVFSFVIMPVVKEGYVNIYGSEATQYKKALEETKTLKQEIEFILGADKTGLDITERKEVESFKNEIISAVSHELHTPLTTIRETISQVLEGILGETTEKQRDFLSPCLKAADHLTRIIDNMMDVSKIESGKIGLKREIIDIKEIVRLAADSFLPQAQSKKLQIRTRLPEGGLQVYVDKDKITQVFTNFIGNALKFTETGYIDISVEEKLKFIECSVMDTGRGIASQDLSKVFGKFQQFGKASGAEEGTGLGLAISKGIVQMHGGRVSVESELNQGSKFTFTLPKYSQEDILKENIKDKITAAKKEYEEFTLFLFKVDNYDDIEKKSGKEKAQNFFLNLLKVLERSVRAWEAAAKADKNEIIILADVDRHNAPKMGNSLKKVIKEFIFNLEEYTTVNFSYGYAVYPRDNGDASGLLKNAYTGLKSDREEKLNKRILIVDDEPQVARPLKKILETMGYTDVKEFYSGQGVLNYLEREKADLVILDMRMPVMSGYEVIGRLKESIETKDIPVLIMSGYIVEQDKLKDHLSQKAILTLAKPFDEKQIERLLAYIL